MKRFLFALSAGIMFLSSGCLKDKDFDDQVYGINDADASPVGVGFTTGTRPVTNTGVFLQATVQQFDSNSVRISLFSGKPAAEDIKIRVELAPSLVDNYNADNDAGDSLVQLFPALYNFNGSVTIPKGSTFGIVNLTLLDATVLSLDTLYGLGLRIVNVDQGILIASNAYQIVLAIAVRNAYEGDYLSNGYLYHPSSPRPILNLAKTLTTINATTVQVPLGDLGGAGYQAFFDVDPMSNLVTVSVATSGAGGPYYQWNVGLPTDPPGPAYAPQWARSSECNNTYDPATQTFKMRYGYIGPTGYRVAEEIMVRQP